MSRAGKCRTCCRADFITVWEQGQALLEDVMHPEAPLSRSQCIFGCLLQRNIAAEPQRHYGLKSQGWQSVPRREAELGPTAKALGLAWLCPADRELTYVARASIIFAARWRGHVTSATHLVCATYRPSTRGE